LYPSSEGGLVDYRIIVQNLRQKGDSTYLSLGLAPNTKNYRVGVGHYDPLFVFGKWKSDYFFNLGTTEEID
jgi:hypothetical protein